jgi:hypothetical protein
MPSGDDCCFPRFPAVICCAGLKDGSPVKSRVLVT